MEGTLSIGRMVRVLTNLALHPKYIRRCFKHNLINGKMSVDVGLPCLSYAAIDFLEDHLNSQMTVCEYGAGGSTLFFARRTRLVCSIEHDPKWHELVRKRLDREWLRNASLRLHPFDFSKLDGFEHSAYLHAIPDQRFDVVVVEAPDVGPAVRSLCFEKAEARIKPGGIIVMNDSRHHLPVRERNRAHAYRTFRSVGPCRPGVLSTDVYFY